MTRTISSQRFPALITLMLLGFLLGLTLLPAATAATPKGERRLSVGMVAGGFRPFQESLRRIYGQSLWPSELQLGYALNDTLAFWVGARYWQASGDTILLQPIQPDESYALRLEVLALRLGMNYWLGRGCVAPFLGAGIQYAFFRERWQDLSIETRGQKAGIFGQMGGRWRLGRSLAALLQLEYSHLPAGSRNGVQEKVNLGGLGLSLGLRVGIL